MKPAQSTSAALERPVNEKRGRRDREPITKPARCETCGRNLGLGCRPAARACARCPRDRHSRLETVAAVQPSQAAYSFFFFSFPFLFFFFSFSSLLFPSTWRAPFQDFSRSSIEQKRNFGATPPLPRVSSAPLTSRARVYPLSRLITAHVIVHPIT